MIVKGVTFLDDARLARDSGADASVASNHGGRQLDSTVSPLRVLPGIVQALGPLPVMVDSGFRRGTNVLKALALGARSVFVGSTMQRPLSARRGYATPVRRLITPKRFKPQETKRGRTMRLRGSTCIKNYVTIGFRTSVDAAPVVAFMSPSLSYSLLSSQAPRGLVCL